MPAAVMALDVVLLTVLLALSGGAFNPFSAMYIVHIALSAVVLRAGGRGRSPPWPSSASACSSWTRPITTSTTCACTCRACGRRSRWPRPSSSTSCGG
ncbi:hypothetical protein ACN28S_52460 [Cystobacter fuscus]